MLDCNLSQMLERLLPQPARMPQTIHCVRIQNRLTINQEVLHAMSTQT